MGGSGSTGLWLNIPLSGFDKIRCRLYGKTMTWTNPTVDLLDDLVRKSQELADLYMRAIDENPAAMVDKPHDANQVDNLLQALAKFYLAQRFAVSAVAAYAAGKYADDIAATESDF